MFRVALYSVALFWVNLYVCREIFWSPAASTASMQGYWIALALRANGAFVHPSWWPYWGCGMPFEYAYAPLIPAATAALAAIQGIPHAFAFHAIAGAVYLLTPLTLFWSAWALTRSAGYSFAAAILYSLTSVTQVIVPDRTWSILNLWHPWRLYALAEWDEAPHLAALALLPPAIFCLWWTVKRGNWISFAAAAVLIAIATYSSAFAPISMLLVAIALVASLEPKDRSRAAVRIGAVGIVAYALSAAFLPPSLIAAMAGSAQNPGAGKTWTAGSFTGLALAILGWTLLWPAVQRIRTPYLRFFLLLAYLTSAIPLIAFFFHREFLPQPKRYSFEMELALCVAIAFGLRPLIEWMPRSVQRAVTVLLVALAAEQVMSYRHEAKIFIPNPDIRQSIEYRTAMWVERNLPGRRVMLPGTIAQWAAAFAPIDQFAGGSWSLAANRTQQLGLAAIFFADARVSLAWLRSFGDGAVVVSGPDSHEFWKPYLNPFKFEGVLKPLWRQEGVTIYEIPQRSASLAHVIPESALVRRAPSSFADIAGLERYASAIEDPSLPLAQFEWTGNHARVRSQAAPGQTISIQLTYHPGWRAASSGRTIPIHRDGLGLMWLSCTGACDISLDYNGGVELNLCRWLSYLTAAGLLAFPLAFRIGRMRMPRIA